MSLTHLYRHFDADGRLLYVGVSLHAVARLAGHKNASGWFNEIVRVDVVSFSSRDEALQAEKEAIRAERPIYNRVRYADDASDDIFALAAELKREQPNNTDLHRYIELVEAAAEPRSPCPRCDENREHMREYMRDRRRKQKQERT